MELGADCCMGRVLTNQEPCAIPLLNLCKSTSNDTMARNKIELLKDNVTLLQPSAS